MHMDNYSPKMIFKRKFLNYTIFIFFNKAKKEKSGDKSNNKGIFNNIPIEQLKIPDCLVFNVYLL
jgi:hypothetical protein